ncbi:hypothetical protein QBC40DRAFT_336153 [Triangularia verruculosa]|uniref:Uncharacterized protein n=1 Tax=Triangularia verruculosa TaxID=2587418 RepID=A0AAN7AXY4_9PEZI|nr:hypothetical protein QBC40DRAFT_336153 [Triangularia verruculosa]
MAPHVQTFPSSQLPSHIHHLPSNRGRKTPDGKPTDLARDCDLFSFVQFDCRIERPGEQNCPVICAPVKRFFRVCPTKNGGTFTAETTSWEYLNALTKGDDHDAHGPGVQWKEGAQTGR